MKLLIVEDDPSIVEALVFALDEILALHEIFVCRSRDSALELITREIFDYAILDLKIPTVDERLDAETTHGEAVYRQLRNSSPGTPVCFLTGFPTDDFVTDLLSEAEASDVWGAGHRSPMVRMLSKKRLDEVVPIVEDARRQINLVDDIEVIADPHPLPLENRVLRIFGRRFQASSLVVNKLAGGLSGVQVRRVTARDNHGAERIIAAAKIGSRAEIRKEISNYNRDVIRLPNGRYAAFVGEVFAGAGPCAGVFYRLIESFESLVAVIRQDSNRAAIVVQRVRNVLGTWSGGQPQSTHIIRDIRRKLVSDEEMACIQEQLTGIDWEGFEQRQIQARVCCQHGDLHCENVLVERGGQPILIDYGRVGEAPAALDPVSLELSIVFHPGCRVGPPHWPTQDQAEHWDDIDTFVRDCPAASFVRAARGWAVGVAAGRREIYATAYAFCVRQLTYADTDKGIATAIIRAVIAASQHT